MEERMSVHKKAAEFFRSILILKSPKHLYPIVRLVGHRNRAPKDVYNVVKNEKDLTALLLTYPEIFEVIGENVLLIENISRSNDHPPQNKNMVISGSNLTPEHICLFFKRILNDQSKFMPFPKKSLFDSWASSHLNDKKTIKDLKELTEFLRERTNIFTIYKTFVVLTEAVDSVNSVVKFCVSVLNSTPSKSCPYKLIMETTKERPPCFEYIIKDVSQLKKFLNCFTTTFSLKENGVILVGNISMIIKQPSSKPKSFPDHTKKQNPLNNTDKIPQYINSNSLCTNNLSSQASSPNTTLSQQFAHILKIGSPQSLQEKEEREKLLVIAATYYLEVMWELKPLNALPIIELYKYKCSAPADIQKVCGTTSKQFKDFLSSCSNFFIVTGENVLPRKNIPRKGWAPPCKGIEEELSSIVLNFFKTYTSHSQPQSLEKLFNEIGKCFVNKNGKKFFESSSDLATFLEMFPESFYVYNGSVINILNVEEDKVFKTCGKKSRKKLDNQDTQNIGEPLDTENEHWKGDILSRTELIKDLETCKLRTKHILNNENVISLDCEGMNLGVDGILGLIQIGTENGIVYIFDVLTVPEMLTEGCLNEICGSNKILKVIHDCRNDSANLFFQFGIILSGIFDTRVAHGVIKGLNKIKNIGFNDLCQLYGAPINLKKDEFKGILRIEPSFWLNRPLTDNMVVYAALDVACLVPHVYNNMRKKLGDLKVKEVLTLSEQEINVDLLMSRLYRLLNWSLENFRIDSRTKVWARVRDRSGNIPLKKNKLYYGLTIVKGARAPKLSYRPLLSPVSSTMISQE